MGYIVKSFLRNLVKKQSLLSRMSLGQYVHSSWWPIATWLSVHHTKTTILGVYPRAIDLPSQIPLIPKWNQLSFRSWALRPAPCQDPSRFQTPELGQKEEGEGPGSGTWPSKDSGTFLYQLSLGEKQAWGAGLRTTLGACGGLWVSTAYSEHDP